MAYTAIPTKNPGDILTSALWNTYLQGNADSGFTRMLGDITLGSTTASFDFTSIPATFAHLLGVAYVRGSDAAATVNAALRFNNDSAADYIYETLNGTGGTAGAASQTAQTSLALGAVAANGAVANVFSPVFFLVPHYTNAANRKQLLAMTGYAGSPLVHITSADWSGTAAVNRITLFPSASSWLAGSRCTLYGLPQ